MAVQTQLFYLNLLNKIFIFIICCFLILISYVFTYLNFIKVNEVNNLINITKGSSIYKIVNLIINDEYYLNKKIYLMYLNIYNNYYNTIKFGEFKINQKLSLVQITNLISKPSNVYRDFTIIGSWQTYQLEKLIFEKFNISYLVNYNDIFADTYSYQSHNKFEEIYELMKTSKNNLFNKHKNNELLKKYSINEIMIIASLVEKEGKTEDDKRLISSVIFNRLNSNLKLEIDATTIFSITKGRYKLKRKLTYKDLKINDSFNTYFIRGLPPEPICFVSRKTIEIILENYKSDYLFYFFDQKNNKHTFSKTYKEHKKLLNEYRKNE